MKSTILLTALNAVLFTLVSCEQHVDKSAMPTTTQTAGEYNLQRADELIEDIFTFVAYTEGDKGQGKPYYCGARWTTWYGVTVKPDGSRVKKNDPVIPKATGKEWCLHHLRCYVIPFFTYFDGRKLSDQEIIASALFIYNVGGENVTGYNKDGIAVGKRSCFLDAVNNGKSAEYCVNCLTGFRSSGGKRANGLLKRHWVEGAVYLGILNSENVLTLCPTKFYETHNMGNYYWLDKRKNIVKRNDFCQLRFDDTTIKTFFRMNKAKNGQRSVKDII